MLRVGSKCIANPPEKVLSLLSSCNCKRLYSNESSLPRQAEVVVIGGGVTGCSTFYHLTKRGIKPILLESNKITSGTTWHTGGLVWSLRPSDTDIQVLRRTKEILTELEKETEVDPGFINNGGIFIARNTERLEEYKRLHTLGHYFNIESQLISPKEAQKLCPILEPTSFYGALYSPTDGYIDPTLYTNALLKAATTNGGKVFENTIVTKLLTEETSQGLKKIVGVETNKGTIKTNTIVNSAGAWGRKISNMVGIEIPIQPMKHSYVITHTIEGARNCASIRCHDSSLYFRPQGDSILFGGYEVNPVILKEVPDDFDFKLFELDKSIFESHWKKATELCPIFTKVGIKSDVCGPESFTPDHKPLVGEDPIVVGMYHNVGYNSLGIMLSGGVGEQLSYWIANGRPDWDMHSFDIRRFSQKQKPDIAWVKETSHEAYAKTYNIVYPYDQKLSGRNLRIDPFHEHLVASGAVMEEALGWERPAYFIKEDRTAPVRGYDWYGNYDHVVNTDQRYVKELEKDLTFDFSRNHDIIKEEALAARTNVALFNLSCYTKMYLAGPDAEEAADWLFTTHLSDKAGKVHYTLSLNSRGGIESDVTITTLEEGGGTLVGPILKGKGYYIVAGGQSGYHTKCHLRKQLYKKNFKSRLSEITDRLGILSIQGPQSLELLQSITESPITHDRFPPGMSHIIKINKHNCRAMRISYIGEMGFELHIPYASCVNVYNKIIEAGKGFDLTLAGFRALDALSLEKGYHLLHQDIRIDDNPVESGLLQFCRRDGQYQGKSIVEKIKQEGVTKRRCFFTLEDNVALYGLETIWRDDKVVGFLRRGNYGFSLDCPIGVGYVKHPKGKPVENEFLLTGDYQIEVRDKKYPATLYLSSPFDPTNQRLYGKYENQFEEQSHFED
ncbi:sarcosine dehydrogenase, mitochondrial isoform X2 [Sitophilus oryzae]|uniref:Sarcosine dehydrogenase, mitochondrial isoform X1 n=1 Tax=Sitophilus oryzae TaxID=7048 RepID=A0A6J2YAP2_SITOR|nr:sarcosine dehydrogenase, mitochondrial isoform X1 [Sitophilus oryzae]XP_030760000.1 sarcosine dehydrogenase, mitochondrial isoform X2 [Sitophilus oryzae]